MTPEDARDELRRAARAAWPGAARASELPFPGYFRAAAEWLGFHAPRVGEALMRRLVADVVEEALGAEREGRVPAERRVPERVRAIWRGIDRRMAEGPAASAGPAPRPAAAMPRTS